MTWWQQIQQSYLADLARIDSTLRADLERAFDSGATTPAEQERAIDQRIAAIDDPNARAEALAIVEHYRAQLTNDLEGSDYIGDIGALSRPDLAQLVAERGLNALEGTATIPTASASAAAAAANLAGGSSMLDHTTGAIDILDAQGKLHAHIPAGQEAPPASIIAGEILSDSTRGGARPVREQSDAAFAALKDAGWDPKNPGDAGVTYPGNGDVLATFPDGSTRIFEHDPIAQLGKDLDGSRGDPGQIADVLDRAAAGLGEAAFGAVNTALGDFGWPNLGGTTTPGGTTSPGGATGPTRTGSSGGSTPGGTTGATGGGSNAPTSPDRTPMEDADPIWTTGDDKPASTGTKPAAEPAAEPAAAAPAAASNDGKNTFMTEEEQEAAAAAATDDGDGEDGWEDSTKKPPTEGTYVDADGDGNPDEEDDASAEDDDEDDDEDEDDDDDEDESGTAVGYTPRPGDDEIRTLTEAEVAALLAAGPGGPNDGWSDGTNVKPTEFDPAFMIAAQRLKLGMIGQQGSPDIDTAPGAGPGLPDQSPGIDPDDDTPGHLPDGHDVGQEDPMQGHFQGTMDGSAGSGGDSTGPTMAPQEIVVAEVNIDRPSVDGSGSMPAMPGYGQAIGGSAAGSAVAPADSASPSAPDDVDPAAAASAADADVPIGVMVEAEINVDLGSRSLPDYQHALGGTAAGDTADGSRGGEGDPDAG